MADSFYQQVQNFVGSDTSSNNQGNNDSFYQQVQNFTGGEQQIPQNLSNGNSNWSNFLQTATPIAQAANFPMSVLAGQAALESGHGTSNFAQQRNNYFGYEAYDSNPDAAKTYNSPTESINDYINLIEKDPRYSWAYQQYLKDKNPLALLQGIKASGYATDPEYVTSVADTPEFQSYAKLGQ